MSLLIFSNVFFITTGYILSFKCMRIRKRVFQKNETEKELWNHLVLIQTILDSQPNMVTLLDKVHQLILCNKAYKETLTVDFLLPLESRFKEQCFAEPLWVWEHGRDISGSHIYTDACENVQKNASYTRRICLDSEGKKLGQLLVLTDVTLIKTAGQLTREMENRLTYLTNSLPSIVLQYLCLGPEDECFLNTSKGIEAIIRVMLQELVEADDRENRLFGFIEEPRLQFILDIAENYRNLKPVDVEVTIPVKDALHYLQIRRNFVVENDCSRLLNGMVQHTTSLKPQQFKLQLALQSAKKAIQTHSHFFTPISHKFRTPISGIHGVLELLQMSELSEYQRYMVHNVAQSSNTLLYLVNDILNISKIDTGELQLQFQSCPLQSTVCDLIRSHAATAVSKKLLVNIDWDTAISDKAVIDPLRVGQIISNLLNNIVKFIHQRSIAISATLQQKEYLAIMVSDTGICISRDNQHQLFKPFEQINSDINRRYSGIGLGLTIYNQLVRKMEAAIIVESESSTQKYNISKNSRALFVDESKAQTMAKEHLKISQDDYQKLTETPVDDNTNKMTDIVHRLKGMVRMINHAQSASEEILQTLMQSIRNEIDSYYQQARS
ncbi:ATP-binding protein [Buttiauxella noackiae]|uniref:ATP-binding protein n=1 Tax=Buttiauxella noackiae TaxID=82992 RepID=UPI00069070C0|nr:ATP-binding protein [Buttiauxella noackiae]